MPLIRVETNVELTETQRTTLLTSLSQRTVRMLNKPERYIMVVIRDGSTLRFAGSSDPCAFIECKSIGLPRDETTRLSRGLCDALTENTDITKERIYIEFTKAEPDMWGWNGQTF